MQCFFFKFDHIREILIVLFNNKIESHYKSTFIPSFERLVSIGHIYSASLRNVAVREHITPTAIIGSKTTCAGVFVYLIDIYSIAAIRCKL